MLRGDIGAEWRRGIPPQDLDAVLAYVARSWDDLRREMPIKHAYQNPERKLTVSLAERLNDILNKEMAGVNGSFAAEAIEPYRDGEDITERGRSDIRFTLGAEKPPEIILEFKKLDGGIDARRRYMGDGVARFVEGVYAKQHNHGVVIGLCSAMCAAELPALIVYVEAAGLNPVYATRRGPVGTFVQRPCTLAPAGADFGTEHDRAPNVGPSPIMLAHMTLYCPSHPEYVAPAPPVAGPRRKRPKARR